MQKKIVGIMGSAQCNNEIYDNAVETGRLLAQNGIIVLCGGRSGVMEGVAKGAKQAGGTTIGILPGKNRHESPPNEFIDIPIFTGLGDARNCINILSCQGIIAISGGYGTLSEISLALKNKVPLVLLKSWSFTSDTMNETLIRVDSPENAVNKILELIQ